MSRHLLPLGMALAALLGAATPAAAQSLPYGDVGDSSSDASGDASSGEAPKSGGRGPHLRLSPYIEAAQVVTAELSPGDDVLTYSMIAAGVDTGFSGRNNAGSLSLRYERRFGWGSRAADSDTISGVARVADCSTATRRRVCNAIGVMLRALSRARLETRVSMLGHYFFGG